MTKWAIESIVGNRDRNGIMRMAEVGRTKRYLEFIKRILKQNNITGMITIGGIMESFSEGIKIVYNKEPEYLGKYFKTINEFGLENGEFSIMMNKISIFLKEVINKKEELKIKEVEGISGVIEEIERIIMEIPIREKKNKIGIQKEKKECTRKGYEEEYKQGMYHCYECEVNCCSECVENCHEGHDTIYLGQIKGICECNCKEEEEDKKKERKRNNEEGVKDKRQQIILKALNRDYKIPEMLREVIKKVRESKESWSKEAKKKKEEQIDMLMKKEMIICTEGIGKDL